MRKKGKENIFFLIIVAAIVGLIFWFLDAYLQTYVFCQKEAYFLDYLILDVSSHALFMRSLVLILSIFSGSAALFYYRRASRTEEELRKKKERLFKSEFLFSTIVENAEPIISVLDKDGKILLTEGRTLSVLGLKPGELVGKSVFELYRDNDGVIDIIKSAYKGKSGREEIEMQGKEGGVYLDAFCTPLRDHRGKVIGIIMMASDITSKTKQYEALGVSEEKYRSLVENVKAVMYKANKDGDTIYVSKYIEKLIKGFNASDWLKKGFWSDRIHPDDRESSLKEWVKGVKSRKPYTLTYRFLDKKGEAIWVEDHAFPNFVDGKLTEVDGFIIDVTENERSQREMRRAKETAEMYLELAGVMFIAIDKKGIVTLANKKAAEILGYREEEIVGKDWFGNFVPENIKKDVRAIFDKLIKGEVEPVEFYENPIVNKAGEERLIAWHNTLLKDEQGNLIGTISSGEDITERKASEIELEKLASIVRYGGELMSLATLDGKITFLNEAGQKMLGFGPDDMGKIKIIDVIPDHYKEVLEKEILPELKKGATWEGDLQYRNLKTRELVDVHAMTFTVKDPVTKEPMYLANVSIDITERKKAEEDVKSLSKFPEENLSPVMRISNDSTIMYANKAAESIFLKTWGSKVGDKLSGIWDKRVEESVRTGRIVETEDEIDGSMIISSVTPIKDEGYVNVYSRDITERRKAEKELQEYRKNLEKLVEQRTSELKEAYEKLKDLDKLKSMFIASMSHELRTPLNSIIGFTGVMLQGLTGKLSDEQKRQLKLIKDSSDHLLKLINDVIDISKIEAGRVDLGISEFNLPSLIHVTAKIYEDRAQEKGLKIRFDMPEELFITSDDRRIRQIVSNYISNAIKYTDKGEIKIIIKQIGENIEIAVQDTGIGILNEDKDKLFKAFSKIQIEGRPEVQGTGLGLYISKKLAEMLDGRVEVESEYGKGSTFKLILPITYKEVTNESTNS